jgi:hypothetical protein
MASSDRIAVYVAESNLDAQFLVVLMQNAGIDAYCIEDNSPGGMFSFGTLDRLHRPEIFVPRDQVSKAKEFVDRYERGEIKDASRPAGPYCYHCGSECDVADTECPSCGSTLDAVSGDDIDSSEEPGDDDSREHTSGTSHLGFLRRLKWPLAVGALVLMTMPCWINGLLAWMEIVRQLFMMLLTSSVGERL